MRGDFATEQDIGRATDSGTRRGIEAIDQGTGVTRKVTAQVMEDMEGMDRVIDMGAARGVIGADTDRVTALDILLMREPSHAHLVHSVRPAHSQYLRRM